MLTPHGPLVFLLLLIVIAVDDHGPQVGLQHGAVVLDHGLRAVAHGAGGPHGPRPFRARLDHGVRVHLRLFLLEDSGDAQSNGLHARPHPTPLHLPGYVRSCRPPPPAPSAAPAASWPSSPWPR